MTNPIFSDEQAAEVLRCARCHVESAGCGRPSPCEMSPELAGRPVSGLFVSLWNGPELRACLGNWHGVHPGPLGAALANAARAAATNDHRFPPIPGRELPALTIEVSILFHPRKADATGAARINEVEVGRHGLILEDSHHRGLLLPQVAAERGWDSETFLKHTALKAGLPKTAWRDPDVELTTFEAVTLVGRP